MVKGRAGLSGHKLRYAHDLQPIGNFLTAIETLKPTAIIGVAAVGGAFTPDVLEAMASLNERPIVFALSNPTSKSECSAEEAYRHTGGRAIFACGSPFDPVKLNGTSFVPRQGNNSYIFPGVGLGVIASGSRLVTDEMFMAAAHTLANSVSEADLKQGSLYPALPRIREVSAQIGAAVADVAYQNGLAVGPAAERPDRLRSVADVRPELLAALEHPPQRADIRDLFDFENGLDQLGRGIAPEHRRGQVAHLVDHLVASHRIARRAAHRGDALREMRAVVQIDLDHGLARRQAAWRVPRRARD